MNGNMTNYIMPTAADLPEIKAIFVEHDTPYGPGRGVKGIGELPMDGVAPAIVNAVNSATGHQVSRIPLLPEDLLEISMRNEAEV